MNRLIQKIRQHYCNHTHTGVTHYKSPFSGFVFQCPKCEGYVAYFEYWNDFVNVSKKKYDLFVEEGEKLRRRLSDYKEEN